MGGSLPPDKTDGMEVMLPSTVIMDEVLKQKIKETGAGIAAPCSQAVPSSD